MFRSVFGWQPARKTRATAQVKARRFFIIYAV
jgi:hypothetical protein